MNKYVTVIIPTYNEEKFIKQCITSLAEQTYDKDKIEIILVDGMSTDKTVSIVETLKEELKLNLKVVNNEKRIAPVAMNLGLKHSNGEIIIRIDGHAYMDKDFIKNSVELLETRDVECVGGPITTINETELAKSISLAMSCPFGVGNALFRYSNKECLVDTLAFGAYKKSVFDKIGYFDEELVRNQDDELNYRLTKAGGKILLHPSIISYYYSRSSMKKLWRQYFQYGFWKVRVIQKHKKPASIRHLIPIAFVSSMLVLGLGSFFSKILLYLFATEISLYALLDIYYSIKLGLKNKSNSILQLLVIFPTLHISYGIGFLLGLINFYLLKSKKFINKNTETSR